MAMEVRVWATLRMCLYAGLRESCFAAVNKMFLCLFVCVYVLLRFFFLFVCVVVCLRGECVWLRFVLGICLATELHVCMMLRVCLCAALRL